MKIERVTVEDAEELLEIYGYYVKNTAISFEYDVPSVEEFRERIKNISALFPYIKAVDDNGKILGYSYANKFRTRAAYAWTVETTIYIRKDVRRSGIGRALYEVLEKSLKEIGVLNMYAGVAALTDPQKEDEHLTNDSIYFHQKIGFEKVAVFHKSGRKFNTWYDMCFLEKMIGEHVPSQSEVKFGEWKI